MDSGRKIPIEQFDRQTQSNEKLFSLIEKNHKNASEVIDELLTTVEPQPNMENV